MTKRNAGVSEVFVSAARKSYYEREILKLRKKSERRLKKSQKKAQEKPGEEYFKLSTHES